MTDSPHPIQKILDLLVEYLPDHPRLFALISEWTPVALACMRLFNLSKELLLALTPNKDGDIDWPDELFQQLRLEFQTLGDEFPDISDLMLRDDEFNNLLQEIMAMPDNPYIHQLVASSQELISKFITRVYFSSTTDATISAHNVEQYLLHASDIIQAVISKWIVPDQFD